jgi:hypothetical protein
MQFVAYVSAAVVAGIVLFFVGVYLKRFSYILAKKDGIDVNDY